MHGVVFSTGVTHQVNYGAVGMPVHMINIMQYTCISPYYYTSVMKPVDMKVNKITLASVFLLNNSNNFLARSYAVK